MPSAAGAAAAGPAAASLPGSCCPLRGCTPQLHPAGSHPSLPEGPAAAAAAAAHAGWHVPPAAAAASPSRRNQAQGRGPPATASWETAWRWRQHAGCVGRIPPQASPARTQAPSLRSLPTAPLPRGVRLPRRLCSRRRSHCRRRRRRSAAARQPAGRAATGAAPAAPHTGPAAPARHPSPHSSWPEHRGAGRRRHETTTACKVASSCCGKRSCTGPASRDSPARPC